MAALFVVPLLAFAERLPPYWVEDHKSVLAFLREKRQPGDAVFVFAYEIEAVERYGAEYGLTSGEYEVGNCSSEDGRAFLRDMDRYRGRRRVWLIDGSVPGFNAARTSLEKYLATIGTLEESISIPSEKPLNPVGAHLFNLSDSVRLAAASAETFRLEPRAPGVPKPRCSDRVRPLRDPS